jgi:hypothetical protein
MRFFSQLRNVPYMKRSLIMIAKNKVWLQPLFNVHSLVHEVFVNKSFSGKWGYALIEEKKQTINSKLK